MTFVVAVPLCGLCVLCDKLRRRFTTEGTENTEKNKSGEIAFPQTLKT